MINLTHLELRKLSAFRAQIETFAAREASTHAGEEAAALAELRRTLTQLKTSVQRTDYENFRAADFRLHEIIVQMARVPQLPDAWRMVWNGLSAFHHQAFEEYFPDLRTLAEEHNYLVEAIAKGDPAAAEDAARSHVEAVWLRVAERRNAPDPESDPLQRATVHLAFRFHAPLRLREVASEVAFTSIGNLSRLFRVRHGMSFQAYLQKLRLEKAAELLVQTQMPVTLIGQRVGYRDLSRFAHHFKRHFGKSPSIWRNGQKQ